MKAADNLRQVLADKREAVQALRRLRIAQLAEAVDAVVEDFGVAVAEFTTWINESDAELRSGYSGRHLRRQFRWMHAAGLARYNDKTHRREYLMCGIPLRADLAAAYAEGNEQPVDSL